ncbi:hypothetical protein COCMIDRAFT_104644 [Bipolaris oryzae ATCC 44560]|uniref:Uncharacterized protein n=1 Tax=Bipolaris oryzae ATCC 44560 TaxID=930090 RepID=W6ZEP9_COCMI|nr:uncharacterized protein COCMIDRAFT_104644 [Bipolaris oryzae ATCC 44560]EUC42001.1 hypothetical protein COCMIDRAFT_104644 [Bipolaris oryzae ATCC 44560]
MTYIHAETQTVWAGLTKMDIRPDLLFTAPDTTTPPAELIPDKQHDMAAITASTRLGSLDAHATSFGGLLQKRQKRPELPTRISLPNSELDDEVLPSPPPTHAILSPLPEANRLHAGHTPLIPRALSPVHSDKGPAAPEEEAPATEYYEPEPSNLADDQPLIGPLMLPTNPVEGASDHIALDVLDDVLEKVAKDQDRFSRLKDAPEPEVVQPDPPTAPAADADPGLSLSRNTSSDSRKSSNNNTEVVDGVRLKTPPLNFGVPIGQV